MPSTVAERSKAITPSLIAIKNGVVDSVKCLETRFRNLKNARHWISLAYSVIERDRNR